MKVMDYCLKCLKGHAERTVTLSGDNGSILPDCLGLIDELWNKWQTPSDISNRLLKYIKQRTNVYDPYASIKESELKEAKRAIEGLKNRFTHSLEGVLKLSTLGNSMDFFIHDGYDTGGFKFSGDIDKIEEEIYIKGKEVLILGDNVGDFLFDMGLIKFLESNGKRVYYAVKEHPVQNDLSMVDVIKFNLRKMFDNIISTGTDEVGIRREDMKGKVKDLWEGDAVVIAKGMGNYETISEFHTERPVIYIMKVKCPTVGDAVNKKVGTYIAILGGE